MRGVFYQENLLLNAAQSITTTLREVPARKLDTTQAKESSMIPLRSEKNEWRKNIEIVSGVGYDGSENDWKLRDRKY